MFHGAELRVLETGIKAPPGLMETIGIYHESRCWGVLVADPPDDSAPNSHRETGRRKGRNRLTYRSPDGESRQHLFISPIHPESWATLLRVELKLLDHIGAMRDAAAVLQEVQANILFAECTYSGFHHATWNLIAESLKDRPHTELIRKKLEAGRSSMRGGNAPDSKSIAELQGEQIRSIYARMLIRAERLRHIIRMKGHLLKEADPEKSPFEPFLHDSQRAHERLSPIWKVEEDVEKGLDKSPFKEVIADEQEPPIVPKKLFLLYQSQRFQAVRVHLLPQLMRAWMYGINCGAPYQFTYDARHSELKPNDPRLYKQWLSEFGSPTVAIASFDTRENYVRLRLFEKARVGENIIDVRISYEADLARTSMEPSASKGGDGASPADVGAIGRIPGSSKGLLVKVCDVLSENDVNLIQLTDLTRESHPQTEIGTIKMVGRIEGAYTEEARKRTTERIRQSLLALRLDDARIVVSHVDAGKHKMWKLFLSTHFAWERFEDVKKMVDECAKRHGFSDIVLPRTHIEGATDTVVYTLSECDAMLQMVAPRAGNAGESLAWLIFEYGLARGKGIPSIRMADTGHPDDDTLSWRSRFGVDQDRYIRTFDSRWDAQTLEKAIDEAVGELADALDTRFRRGSEG
ncbi:MAG: hypothetical protein JST22_20635 [Bacteroidetes bacterium]|nr:hypothetical protein [Bacteroidota bacterium]